MSTVNSATSRIRDRDQRMSKKDWLRLTKHSLQLRCANYGLSVTGVKVGLANRLFSYFHGDGISSISEDDRMDEAEVQPNYDTEEVAESNPNPASVPLEELRTLIREEIQASRQASQSMATTDLSPASITTPATPLTHTQPAPSLVQGNLSVLLPSISQGSLPPLSAKLMKSIQNKEFIDLNSLLPNALYDNSVNPGRFSFTIDPSDSTSKVSVSPSTQNKQKINNSVSWFEAWNIYIQAMVNFHPELAKDMLAYQESICTFQRTYPVSAWLRYDTAFRMNIGLNKSLSWARLDEYAFTRFLRCATSQQTPSQ